MDYLLVIPKTQGDFLIDGKTIIEVGGKDRSFEQIADIPNSYILADSMEFPIGKYVPVPVFHGAQSGAWSIVITI